MNAMSERREPGFEWMEAVVLRGRMVVYGSQAEASEGIPGQWREFLGRCAEGVSGARFYGASPCTGDRKLHYLTGVAVDERESVVAGERLVLEAGEYAVVRVEDAAVLREAWVWMLRSWLPESGRRERRAPEFERFSGISEAGMPVGPVEIGIPLEPVAGS